MEDVRLIFERGRAYENGTLINPPCAEDWFHPEPGECTAYTENPIDYVEEQVCPACPWGKEIENPEIYKLLDYIGLQNAGCPIDRDELRNEEWRAMGQVKAELDRLAMEDAKKKGGGHG